MKISKLVSGSGTQVDRLISFLNTQPDDEVFTTAELRERFGKLYTGGAFSAQKSLWKEYTALAVVNGLRVSVWGNKQAIANLKQELAKETHEN